MWVFLGYAIKSIQDLKFWLGITWNTDRSMKVRNNRKNFFHYKKDIHKIVLKKNNGFKIEIRPRVLHSIAWSIDTLSLGTIS